MGVLERRMDGPHLHTIRYTRQGFRQRQQHSYVAAICKFVSSYCAFHGTKRIRSTHACVIKHHF